MVSLLFQCEATSREDIWVCGRQLFSSSLLACRFKVLDNIGKKLTQLYVSVTVLMMMMPLALAPVLVEREFSRGELIVAVREVGGANLSGSRHLVSESDHNRLRNVRGDGDFIGTESGPFIVVDLKRRE